MGGEENTWANIQDHQAFLPFEQGDQKPRSDLEDPTDQSASSETEDQRKARKGIQKI